MRKISLDVDALEVESFQTVSDDERKRGTVDGNSIPGGQRSVDPTFCATQCGDRCLSGWQPCQPSDAWTDGMAACMCADTTGRCID